jgi:hypothetical protein
VPCRRICSRADRTSAAVQTIEWREGARPGSVPKPGGRVRREAQSGAHGFVIKYLTCGPRTVTIGEHSVAAGGRRVENCPGEECGLSMRPPSAMSSNDPARTFPPSHCPGILSAVVRIRRRRVGYLGNGPGALSAKAVATTERIATAARPSDETRIRIRAGTRMEGSFSPGQRCERSVPILRRNHG